MSNRDLPMMPWYPDQFAASTAAWTWIERAVYRALLDAQWALGALPQSEARLSKLVGMPINGFRRAWATVQEKFPPTGDGHLRNFRLEQHRLAALKYIEGKRKGAQATNARRWSHSDESASRSATGERVVSVSPPSPSPSPSGEGKSVPPERVNPARELAASMTVGKNGKHKARQPEQDPEPERVKRALTLLEADPKCTEHEAARMCHVSVDAIREARHR